jgi:hypothetical protein
MYVRTRQEPQGSHFWNLQRGEVAVDYDTRRTFFRVLPGGLREFRDSVLATFEAEFRGNGRARLVGRSPLYEIVIDDA